MESKVQVSKIIPTVNIFNRERLELIGATEVLSSTDKEVIVKLFDSFAVISGTNLTILKLVPEEQLLQVSGNILGIKYVSKLNKKSFLGKVFK